MCFCLYLSFVFKLCFQIRCIFNELDTRNSEMVRTCNCHLNKVEKFKKPFFFHSRCNSTLLLHKVNGQCSTQLFSHFLPIWLFSHPSTYPRSRSIHSCYFYTYIHGLIQHHSSLNNCTLQSHGKDSVNMAAVPGFRIYCVVLPTL